MTVRETIRRLWGGFLQPAETPWPLKRKATLSGRPAELPLDAPAPAPIDPGTGMHKDYWVLPEEERRKGFVRPVRSSYRHVGVRPEHPTRPLTAAEAERYRDYGYVCFEPYPAGGSVVGRFWTRKDLDSGCNAVTSMGTALAETYARDPKYYGSTFCVHCRAHFPVAEFVWDGTDQRVGS